ncbi:MAG TPA: hypothetical protein VL359_11855, partial [bacterium]|nr:hypothetical protein [bacterium]
DSSVAKQHMILQGAGFTSATGIPAGTTTDPLILPSDVSGGKYVETCEICHGAGTTADVSVVHTLQ